MSKNSLLFPVILLLIVTFTLSGCASKVTTSSGYSPEELGQIGAKISENPDNSRNILLQYDMSESEFRGAVREIASKPKLARRYHLAYLEASTNI